MNAKRPKYTIIAQWLRDKIQRKEYFPSDKLPSEHMLASQFSVSRQTVRHALSVLEQEGLVKSVRGSGTFVVDSSGKYEGKSEKNSKIIGVISTYLDSYIFPNLITGIEGVLSQHGYTMQLLLTHNQVEHETRALTNLLSSKVDGVIVEPTKSGLPNPNLSYYEKLGERVPIVFFHAKYPSLSLPLVALDDVQVGKLATEHLIAMGHRRIAAAFLSDDQQGHLRYLGYTQALAQAGLPFHSSDVLWFTTEDAPLLGRDRERLTRLIQNCSAVVCYNDQTALDILTGLKRLGLRVPRDISLVGVDDSELARRGEIPLTTITHPSKELGHTAAQCLLDMLQQGGTSPGKIFIPTLIQRDSVLSIP